MRAPPISPRAASVRVLHLERRHAARGRQRHLAAVRAHRHRADDADDEVPEARIDGAVRQLVAMGLLAQEAKLFVSQPKRLHLDKTSPTFKTCHGNWRLKIAADVATQQDPAGVHYTSAMTISREAAARLRQSVLEHIESARATSIGSSMEEIYVLALDFYPVTPSMEQDD